MWNSSTIRCQSNWNQISCPPEHCHSSQHYWEFFKMLIKTYSHFLICFLISDFLNYRHSGTFVLLAQWSFGYALSSCIFSPMIRVHPNPFSVMVLEKKMHAFFFPPKYYQLGWFPAENSSSKSLIGVVKSCFVEMQRP